MISTFLTVIILAHTAYGNEFTIGSMSYWKWQIDIVNCQGPNNEATKEAWFWDTDASQNEFTPVQKYYAPADTFWEGGSGIDVNFAPHFNGDNLHFTAVSNAHQVDEGFLIGNLGQSPCYTYGPSGSMFNFNNGWICWKLYSCNSLPNVVMQVVMSEATNPLSVTDRPYSTMLDSILSQISPNQNPASFAPLHFQFTDPNGNNYDYVADVFSNVNENAMWMVQAALYAGYNFNPNVHVIGSHIDDEGAGSVLFGPGAYPAATLINFYYGRNKEKFIQLRVYQTSFQSPPPTSCQNDPLAAASGIGAIVSAVVGVASIAAAPVTGGASLVVGLGVAAGVAGASSGVFATLDGLKCSANV